MPVPADRLLENAYYIITPTPLSNPDKVEEMRQLVTDTGAVSIVLDYDEHDYATAAISHLPHVIAYTLVNLVRTSDNPKGLMRQLAAGGFQGYYAYCFIFTGYVGIYLS